VFFSLIVGIAIVPQLFVLMIAAVLLANDVLPAGE
jgi:hypothetical protein